MTSHNLRPSEATLKADEARLICLAKYISKLKQTHPKYTYLCRQLSDQIIIAQNNTFDFCKPSKN